MLRFQLRIFCKILKANRDIFGFNKTFFQYLFFIPIRIVFMRLMLSADRIFFPCYQKIQIKNPIFIIGQLRSGTTLLHRLLAYNNELCAFELWQIILPSLTSRKLFYPIIKWLKRKNNGVFLSKGKGHETNLFLVEEEELLFIHNLNTQFIALITPLGLCDENIEELVFSDKQSSKINKSTMKYFKGCLQRQIYYTGNENVVCNMNYSGMRLRSIIETFPDAKIIYIIRSPFETIPSHLTLDLNIIYKLLKKKEVPNKNMMKYFEKRYKYDILYYKYIEKLFNENVLNEKRAMIVSYDQLKNNLNNTINNILNFTGLKMSQKWHEHAQEVINKQKRYIPSHNNLSLECFGLNPNKIEKDLKLILKRYGFI